MDTQLGSWHDGPAKAAVTGFVEQVTRYGGSGFVPPEQRVAVFDNDGTLWCEKPIQIQLDFTLRRLVDQADEDPQLRHQQPWQAAYQHDLDWFGAAMTKHYHGDDGDLKPMLEFTGGSTLPALRLLVSHDDPEREFDYSDGAELARAQAEAHRWTVVSLKRDWRQVFRTDPAAVRGA